MTIKLTDLAKLLSDDIRVVTDIAKGDGVLIGCALLGQFEALKSFSILALAYVSKNYSDKTPPKSLKLFCINALYQNNRNSRKLGLPDEFMLLLHRLQYDKEPSNWFAKHIAMSLMLSSFTACRKLVLNENTNDTQLAKACVYIRGYGIPHNIRMEMKNKVPPELVLWFSNDLRFAIETCFSSMLKYRNLANGLTEQDFEKQKLDRKSDEELCSEFRSLNDKIISIASGRS